MNNHAPNHIEKSLPDESNRPAIEEMLLHAYEFAMAGGLSREPNLAPTKEIEQIVVVSG